MAIFRDDLRGITTVLMSAALAAVAFPILEPEPTE